MKTAVVAVIGCGRIANGSHFPALSQLENVRIKYACDLILEKAEKAKADFPKVENVIVDYKVALADPEVECVFVLTPNYAHYTVTMDALRAGKHVMCEKPITVNYALSVEMAEEAKKQGKILNIGVCNRYHKSVELLAEMNREGKFGNIYHVYCSFRCFRNIPGLGGAFTDKAQSGGGVLIDWGIHFFDLILYILGGAKLKNVTLYEGNWTTPTSGVKTWTGDIIPITFTIYNTIIKEDGTAQDIRVATNLIYQPADVKLVFGIGEFNALENGQYYGVRGLAVYKGDTSIPYDFNFEKVYDYTEWGEQLAEFDPRGISNDAYNFANGYNWSTLSNGEGISVDAEGVVSINSATDKSQGAYTPHPFGNEWNLGYYELEMTVNNAHRLKLDIIKSGDQDRVGFDILPNGNASSFAGSMGDEKAYLTAGNAASLYVSAGNSFGDGVINAGGLKTIIYDKYVAIKPR